MSLEGRLRAPEGPNSSRPIPSIKTKEEVHVIHNLERYARTRYEEMLRDADRERQVRKALRKAKRERS